MPVTAMCRAIVVDDVGGGRLAARHLIDLGHTELAFVGDPPRLPLGFSSSRLRLRGVRREVAAGPARVCRRTASRPRAHGQTIAADLDPRAAPHGPDRPTAILCASDAQAIGALEAAASLGVEVPSELSIVGYDDIELAAYVGLTTVRQPLYDMGVAASRWLIGALRGSGEGPLREIAEFVVVARRTSGPPPSRHHRGPV